ncbi:MAG TPA: DUF4388 domain-containing protein [Anaeromyxobacteraceae bacterium]|nr:DUF4388 domain-containing protein [Anaeromyxobacteraceae bacterium]
MTLRGRLLLYVGREAALARILSDAAAERGGTAAALPTGGEALARARGGGLAAAVVDLPLADIPGDKVLLALREHGVPCLVISRIPQSERSVATLRELGAATVLEKPVDARVLLSHLDRALGGLPAHGKPSAEDQRGPGRAPPGSSSAREGWEGPAEPPAGDFESRIFSEARPALDETPPGLPLRTALSALERPLPAAPPRRAPGARPFPELKEGDLGATRVTRLLAALHAAKATGALTLTQGRVRKLVLLEAGHPVFAASNAPAERFAARCLRERILSPKALASIMAEIGPNSPLNEALLARGLLDLERRARMLRDQVSELLWSTFAWREGYYRMSVGVRARRPIVPVELRAGELIFEGLRHTAELESLRRELPDPLSLVPGQAPAFRLAELRLKAGEEAMVAQADGSRSVHDLVALSGLGEHQALAVLQGCLDVGVLDAVSRLLTGTRRMGFM